MPTLMNILIFAAWMVQALSYCPFMNQDLAVLLDREKSYSSNMPAFGASFTMIISRNKNKVVIHRSQGLLNGQYPDNILFFEAQPDHVGMYDSYVKVSDTKNNLWFIPFLLASPAVPLGEVCNQCLLFQCVYGGFPNTMDKQENILQSKIGLQCDQYKQNPGNRPLKPFTLIVPCDDLQAIDMSRVYTGGVVIRAEKVEVVDPIGTQKDEGIKFYQMDNGDLILYQDAINMGLIKKE